MRKRCRLAFKYSLNENAPSELHKALYDTGYRDEVLLRDVTPDIMLSQNGVKNLPMAMNASHIRENVFSEDEARKLGLKVDEHTHYHGLGEKFFLQIIDGLDNVKEAYRGTKNAADTARRENYFLLVSEFKDKQGNTINVPVYIDERANYNRVFVGVNKISTAFGRDNFREYINRQIREKNLVRIKNRSTQVSEGPALIARAYEMDASNNSITQNFEKSTETAKKVSTDGKVVQMSLKDGANQQTSDDIDELMRSAGIEGDAAEIREDLAELYRMNSKATSKGRIFTNANRKSRSPLPLF